MTPISQNIAEIDCEFNAFMGYKPQVADDGLGCARGIMFALTTNAIFGLVAWVAWEFVKVVQL